MDEQFKKQRKSLEIHKIFKSQPDQTSGLTGRHPIQDPSQNVGFRHLKMTVGSRA
jgi:hypothetical protein